MTRSPTKLYGIRRNRCQAGLLENSTISSGCASASSEFNHREDRPRPPSLPATGWGWKESDPFTLPLGLWLDGSIIILLRLSSPSARLHPCRLSLGGSAGSVRSCSSRGSHVTRTAENVEDMSVFSCQGTLYQQPCPIWSDLWAVNPVSIYLPIIEPVGIREIQPFLKSFLFSAICTNQGNCFRAG